MKNLCVILLTFLAVSLNACRERNDVGPDLTTPLVGVHAVQYTIVNTNNNQVLKPTPTAKAYLVLNRKNNNTLTAQVSIVDGSVRVDDQFEITVSLDSKSNDGLLRPGLENRYKIEYAIYRTKGVSSLNRYKDGVVTGGLGYNKTTGEQIIIGLYP